MHKILTNLQNIQFVWEYKLVKYFYQVKNNLLIILCFKINWKNKDIIKFKNNKNKKKEED